MECDSFIDIEFTGEKEKKMIDRLVKYKQFLKKCIHFRKNII